jgi:PAS domain S-box-containing protein
MVRPWQGPRSIDWYLWLLVISALAPAFALSAYLLWTTVQQGVIDDAARTAIRHAAIAGAGLLLLALLCAYAIVRKLRAPIAALARQAAALGRGEQPDPIDTPVREIAVVTAALSIADADLRERARQRDAADDALRTSQAQFQTIMEHAPVLVFVKDLAGKYTFVNRTAESWAGAAIRPAVGQTVGDIMPKAGADEVAQADATVVATKAPLQREMTITTPIGPRTMLSVKFPLLDATNAVSAVAPSSPTSPTASTPRPSSRRRSAWRRSAS